MTIAKSLAGIGFDDLTSRKYFLNTSRTQTDCEETCELRRKCWMKLEEIGLSNTVKVEVFSVHRQSRQRL